MGIIYGRTVHVGQGSRKGKLSLDFWEEKVGGTQQNCQDIGGTGHITVALCDQKDRGGRYVVTAPGVGDGSWEATVGVSLLLLLPSLIVQSTDTCISPEWLCLCLLGGLNTPILGLL